MSYSSAISPTISSRASSIVTRPAVPPYSSTAMAICTRADCISRSKESTGLLSGTKYGGRIRLSTSSSCSASRCSKVRRIMSLRYTIPTTSSAFSPITGIRENPERNPSDIAWRSDLSRSINTTSVRGTMTSLTKVSPNSKTEWIIWRSSSSIKESALA